MFKFLRPTGEDGLNIQRDRTRRPVRRRRLRQPRPRGGGHHIVREITYEYPRPRRARRIFWW